MQGLTQTYKQPSILWIQTADSTAIANTTTETIYDQEYTFPAGSIEAGDIIHAEWFGTIGITSTPTIVWTARWGGVAGTSLAATSTLAVTATGFKVTLDIIARSTTSFLVSLEAQVAANVGAVASPAAVTVATTAATNLTLTATWSAASSSNTTKTTGAYIWVGKYGV